MRAARHIMRGMTVVISAIGAASAPAAEPRGTLEGFHAAAQVSRDEYIAVHNDLLYTHDGDDRLFFENEHNLALLNIYGLLARYGLNPTLEPFTFYNYPAWNVYGEVIGTTRPDEIYIIGAHYDTYASDNPEVNGSPGSDDNATGVTAALADYAGLEANEIGVYDVVISSYCGTATSAGATLAVTRGAP